MNSPLYGKFRVSQKYKGVAHKGIDLVGVDSKEIHSTIGGLVEVAGWDVKPGAVGVDPNYGMGQYVRVKGNNTNYMYYFAHMSKLNVSVGQSIKKGDVIGIEGSTGHSTGAHVHYEIRRATSNNTFLNVSELSGIPNELGTYVQEGSNMDAALVEARRSVQEKAGLDDNTMNYLGSYQYGDELILKLAAAMKQA